MVNPKKNRAARRETDRPPKQELTRAFRVALVHLERLMSPPVGANPALGNFLNRLIAVLVKLEDVPPEEILRSLESRAGRPQLNKGAESVRDVKLLSGISLTEAEKIIADQTTPKDELLRLVRERFGGSTGVLSRLNRHDLVDRIETFIRNERSHETLARLASGEAPKAPGAGITMQRKQPSSSPDRIDSASPPDPSDDVNKP